MENIAKNPGLLDIAEKIFLQLNYEDLMAWHLDLCNSAKIGQLDLIKILAPLSTNNLKAADTNGHEWFKGFTPIHHAAYFGHIEIIKILVPLLANPNPAAIENNATPIQIAVLQFKKARRLQHQEIVNILIPYQA